MVTNLKVLANSGINLTKNVPYSGVGSDPTLYIELDLANDKLIWSDGSTRVAHGSGIPSNAELNEAAPVITTVEYEVPKLFFADANVNTIWEIPLAGISGSPICGSGRYVLCFEFDKDTASIPQLEAWDDVSHTTINLGTLGDGSPSKSWFRAICTTETQPSSGWENFAGTTSGVFLAGSGIYVGPPASGRLKLSSSVLPASGGQCYANIAVVIPANFDRAISDSGVLTCRYTYN